MQWLSANYPALLGVILLVTEVAAAICQLAFPTNKGLSGIMQGIIKAVQSLGAKNPTLPQ